MTLLQRTVRHFWTALIFIAVVLTIPAQTAHAQKTLTYDQPVVGQITDTTPRDTWSFDVLARDRVAVMVSRTAGSLVPTVEILDGNHQRIAQANIDPTAGKAIISNFKFPAGGSYTIVVGRDNDQSSGSYQLALTLRGAGPERPELYDSLETVFSLPKLMVYAEISNEKWVGVWPLVVRSKDRLRLTVIRQDGNLTPTLTLLDSQDQIMASGAVNSTEAMAALEVTLPAPDTYKIRVSRKDDEDGDTVGKYALLIETLGLGADNEIFSTVQGWVRIDTPRPGRLLASRWQETWTFSTDKAIQLSITVRRMTGTLVPRVTLLDVNRNELQVAEADAAPGTASIRGYKLPRPGQYLVVVGRQGDAAGNTEGTYQLLLARDSQRAVLFSISP